MSLPQNGSLPRGGGPGWGQGYKFQKTYIFAWFGKRSIVYQVEVLQLVRQLIAARGLTVVVIIHDINLAARFCDALIALKAGRLCRFAPVGEVMSAAALQEVFGVQLHLLDHPDGKHRVAVV